MNDIIAVRHYYEVESIISSWNKTLINKGRVTVDDLEGIFFIEFPRDSSWMWTNLLTMDNFKIDKNGLYILMLPDPKKFNTCKE